MGAKSTGSHPTTTKADGHLLEYFRQNFGAGGGATAPGVDANYFGDESDGAFNSSGATSLTVTNKNGSYDGDMMVRQHSSFILNAGHNYTVDQPCRGLVILCTGDVSISGTLTMSARGAYADTVDNSTNPNSNIPTNVPSNGLIWKFVGGGGGRSLSPGSSDLNGAAPPSGDIYTWLTEQNNRIGSATGSEVRLSRQGAAGGNGGDGSPNSQGNDGNAGTAGTNSESSGLYTMQTGGGGGGGNGAWSGSVQAGDGSYGSCFGGGSGGGGVRSSNPNSGHSAAIWGGAGGPGDDGGTFNYCGGGGAGNPGGTGNANDGTADPGEAGTGGLVVIVARGNVTVGPAGSVRANGKDGGDASGHPDGNRVEAGGGGSGAGIILIAHGGSYTNNGALQANGGNGGIAPSNSGGAGGAGAIRVIPIGV